MSEELKCRIEVIEKEIYELVGYEFNLNSPKQLGVALFEKLGLPEGLIPLSEAIIYVAEAEKSNTVVEAMYSAGDDAEKIKDDNVPAHLKNYEFASKEDKKNKANYKYPHDFGGYVDQQYLPDSLKDKVYYTPKNNGYENVIKEIRKRKGKRQ